MQGGWSVVEIAGKPADVFEPPDLTRSRVGILYLHDADQRTLRDRPAYTRLFDELALVCVCPHGDGSWWTDRLCPNFDPHKTAENYLLNGVLPFLAQCWQLPPRAVGLLGVGMGGQGALRLAFKHPKTFPVVAGIASALDYHELYGDGTPLDAMYDSKEQCRQDTAILHLHPSHYPPHIFYCVDPDDPWYRGNDRVHEKMNALGVPHEIEFTAGQGEDYVDRMAGRAVRFLVAGLETESRRLL